LTKTKESFLKDLAIVDPELYYRASDSGKHVHLLSTVNIHDPGTLITSPVGFKGQENHFLHYNTFSNDNLKPEQYLSNGDKILVYPISENEDFVIFITNKKLLAKITDVSGNLHDSEALVHLLEGLKIFITNDNLVTKATNFYENSQNANNINKLAHKNNYKIINMINKYDEWKSNQQIL
jgi:hypothetical protein